MDFIINHSGLFLAIGIIALLAIIGYYVDKSDNENKKENGTKEIKKEEVKSEKQVSEQTDFNELPEVPFDDVMTFDELPNSDKKLNDVISEFSDSGNSSSDDSLSIQESPSLENISSDIDQVESNIGYEENTSNQNSNAFGINDFESLNLSLADLEKKNFDELNKSNNQSDDENYFYIDMEEAKDPIGGADSKSIDLIQNSGEDVSINSDYNTSEFLDTSVSENESTDSFHELNTGLDVPQENLSISNAINTTVDSVDNLDEEDNQNMYLFDNETEDLSSDNNLDVNISESNDENNVQTSYDSVPELFSENDSDLSYDSNSSNDDIWKF